MKITHICLCGPVTDNWSYQDNLLPKYHKKLGYEVSVITSKYIYNQEGKLVIDPRDQYLNEFNIKTIRLETKNNKSLKAKFKRYENLYQTIHDENPHIIFIHGVQFKDVKVIVNYLKRNKNVIAYVDNHADFSNSATNWLSKTILHGFIWKKYTKMIEPYVMKFYGVLPSRVDFLRDVYKVPQDKIELLLMGADDEQVKEVTQKNVKNEIRKKHEFSSDDFLIVTGGKIDYSKKSTLSLMKAVKDINHPKVKLLIFGPVVEGLKEEFHSMLPDKKIVYIEWIDGEESYKYFASADLVIFPGRHSVYWEQVAGLGIPMIVKHWEGTNHIDAGGNCQFLYKGSIEEIKRSILNLISDENAYFEMKEVAENKARKKFSYYEIAKKSVNFKSPITSNSDNRN